MGVLIMWFIGRKSKPERGAVSGPQGWKTREECGREIKYMNQELISGARDDLKVVVKIKGEESIGAKWAADLLERRIKDQDDFIPIEVKK